MSTAVAGTGVESDLRVLVFKEEDKFVAQCLEYDVAVQADDMNDLIDRLTLTLEAEFAMCSAESKRLCDCLPPAPNYYHGLWDKRSAMLTPTVVTSPQQDFGLQFGMAA